MTTIARPIPPGATSTIAVRSALVIAPHFDDEVFGCGGLLARLAASGAVVRTLFLSDGAAGGAGEDPVAVRARRKAEAAAAARALGLGGSDALDLPDGALARHLEPAAAGIRRALLAQRPQLVLVPSPLEISEDHRAAFAALHRLLSPARGGDDLTAAIEGATILVYELNHPAYPDLLVDVSGELPLLEEAMRAYASQLALHPYDRAALALRRYRTLTLPPPVAAAEGFRKLTLADFTTRSLAALVTHLGGDPAVDVVRDGPLVSVVVRTRDRPELLGEALESVARSAYRNLEVVLVNDGGRPPEPVRDYPFVCRRVDLPENRGRAAAANAGIAAATGAVVSFLDDDDLVDPEHYATLVALLQAEDVRVAYTDAAVALFEVDPSANGWREVDRRLPYSRDFDADLLLFDNYIPFHTVAAERTLLLEAGRLDVSLPIFEDWDLLIRLSRRAAFVHHRQVTCVYRQFRGGRDHALGERPAERADFLAMKARVIAKHIAEATPERLARVIDRLRREAVETESRMGADARGLREALRTHEAVVAEQADVLKKVYAEIERLNALIRAMEGTRAWRLHRFLHGERG